MESGSQAYTEHYLWCKHDGRKVFGVLNLPAGAEEAFFTGVRHPTVVLAHGFGGTHKTVQPYAKFLASHGFVTYALDFCGGGIGSRSDGSTTEMTVETERDDLRAAVRLMLDEPFVDRDRLFLLGESQGGFVSTLLADEEPGLFRGLVLLYPAYVLHDDAVARTDDGRDIPESEEVMGVPLSGAYARAAIAHDPFDHLSYGGPVLLVHGDSDVVVPLSYSRRAAEGFTSARLEVIPGANHGFVGEERDRAAQLVLDFMRGVGRSEA